MAGVILIHATFSSAPFQDYTLYIKAKPTLVVGNLLQHISARQGLVYKQATMNGKHLDRTRTLGAYQQGEEMHIICS